MGRGTSKAGKSRGLNLNLQFFATMPEGKFTQYSLNPAKEPNKARVFKETLGYTLEN